MFPWRSVTWIYITSMKSSEVFHRECCGRRRITCLHLDAAACPWRYISSSLWLSNVQHNPRRTLCPNKRTQRFYQLHTACTQVHTIRKDYSKGWSILYNLGPTFPRDHASFSHPSMNNVEHRRYPYSQCTSTQKHKHTEIHLCDIWSPIRYLLTTQPVTISYCNNAHKAT